MDKQTRLNMIREAVKRRPALTEQGAEFIEQAREEDPDLGGVVVGVLPPEDVRQESPPTNEDEENDLNTEEISPLMRAATEG